MSTDISWEWNRAEVTGIPVKVPSRRRSHTGKHTYVCMYYLATATHTIHTYVLVTPSGLSSSDGKRRKNGHFFRRLLLAIRYDVMWSLNIIRRIPKHSRREGRDR